MFERNVRDGGGSLLMKIVRVLVTGVGAFFLGSFISLPVTVLWARHQYAGEAQAPLAGIAVSFYIGLAAGIVGLIFEPLMLIPRIQIFADYACAWIVLALGFLGILRTELVHPVHAVLDTPLLWILLAMLNLLRLHNGYGVKGLKVFCIGANVAVLALEAVRVGMFGALSLIVAVPILAETLFSIVRDNLAAVRDCR